MLWVLDCRVLRVVNFVCLSVVRFLSACVDWLCFSSCALCVCCVCYVLPVSIDGAFLCVLRVIACCVVFVACVN